MNPDGSFYDYVGKTAPWSKDSTQYQTFTATMVNEAGFMPGVARPVMIWYPGYGGELFGVMGHRMENNGIRTNDYYYHPAMGMKMCDDPTYP